MSLACILVNHNLMFQPKKNYYQNPIMTFHFTCDESEIFSTIKKYQNNLNMNVGKNLLLKFYKT